MLCRRCGTLNADEKEFCRRCGASLHWHVVVGPESSRDRQGVVGLGVAGVVLALGLLVAYVQPSGASPRPSMATLPAETPTVAATAMPITSSTVGPAGVTQPPASSAGSVARPSPFGPAPSLGRPGSSTAAAPAATSTPALPSPPTPSEGPDTANCVDCEDGRSADGD